MPSFLKLIRREVRLLLHRPIYLFCMVVAPLLCFAFFTSLMQKGLPEELPLGVVDNDGTATTRRLLRNLDAFQMSHLTARYASVTEARRAVQRGEVYGFFYIPRGTTRLAQRGEIPTISFYTNYSYLVAASLLYRDMRTMAELAGGAAGRTVLYARGASERQAMATLQPIVVDSNPIGNPWLNYNVYLSNTLLPGILLLFIFMVTVYALGTEVKRGTARQWLVMAGGSMPRALAGKLLPHTLVFLAVGGCYVVGFYGVLHFPCHCGMATMMGIMALAVLAAQGMGVFMYAMLPTLRLGLSFASLWGVISFSICGMSFPVMAMHPALQGVSLLFPLRHYFLLYVNCALDGYPLLNAAPYALGLCGFALLPALVMPRLRRVLLTMRYEP